MLVPTRCRPPQACAAIRGTPLVSLERKRMYELGEFEARQAAHQVRRGVGRGARRAGQAFNCFACRLDGRGWSSRKFSDQVI